MNCPNSTEVQFFIHLYTLTLSWISSIYWFVMEINHGNYLLWKLFSSMSRTFRNQKMMNTNWLKRIKLHVYCVGLRYQTISFSNPSFIVHLYNSIVLHGFMKIFFIMQILLLVCLQIGVYYRFSFLYYEKTKSYMVHHNIYKFEKKVITKTS